MKKIIFLFIIAFSLIACSNEANNTPIETATDITKSNVYLEVIKYKGGDFAGFNLGDEIEVASKVFGEENLIENETDYLFYKFEETYTNSEYQLTFADNKLSELYLDAYIYDETGTFDRAASSELFNEIKDDFLKKFGNKYMETSNEKNEILYWSNDKKNIQLIHEVSKAAVHVYLDISEFEE